MNGLSSSKLYYYKGLAIKNLTVLLVLINRKLKDDTHFNHDNTILWRGLKHG